MRARAIRWGATFGALLALVAGIPAAQASPVAGYAAGPLDADTVHFIINARSETETGTFQIVHQTPTGLFANLAGSIDCVVNLGGVRGPAAWLFTGTIRQGYDGLGINPVGHRVSMLFDSDPVPRVHLDVSFFSGHAIPRCSSDAVVSILITKGKIPGT